MSCACLQNVITKVNGMPPVTLPQVSVPPCVQQLGAALASSVAPPVAGAGASGVGAITSAAANSGAAAAANVAASAAAGGAVSASGAIAAPGAANLGISPATLAQLSGIAPSMAQIQASLGVNLASPAAPAQLSAIAKLMNSLPFDSLKVPSIPNLSPITALFAVISVVKAKLGVNLLAPDAAAKLNAALSGPTSAASSASAKAAMTASAQAAVSATASNSAQLASVTSAASALGVDLSAPGGMSALTASLNKLASLQMALNVSPASLASLAGFLASVSTLQGAGINLLAGNAAAQLQATLAPLNALNSVSLSPSSLQAAAVQMAASQAGKLATSAAGQVAAKGTSQMAVKAGQSVSATGQIAPASAAAGNLSALTPKDLSALSSVQMPNLAPMQNVSTVMNFATANSACGSACPLTFVP